MRIYAYILAVILLAQQPATPTLDTLLKEIASLKLPVPPVLSLTVPVPAGANLQTFVDAALPGSTLLLEQGATYKVNLRLRNKVSPAPITIRTAGLDDTVLKPGIRVTPADAVKMAKLVCADCLQSIIGADAAGHGYTFIGLEFLGNVPHPERSLVQFGVTQAGFRITSDADMPSDVTFDRIVMRADDALGGRQGILLDGAHMAVLNSHLDRFWRRGQDSQALGMIQGKGPYRIENNYLSASGENFLVGGSDPGIVGQIPSDIVFRGNYVWKDPAWKTKGLTATQIAAGTPPYASKNLFELKNAQRVLIEGNVFENNWVDGQPGNAILFTIRNQDGGCPTCIVRDVVFQHNVLINGGVNAFSISGTDNNFVSDVATNIKIVHNLLLGVSRGFMIGVPVVDLEVAHNTFVGVTNNFFSMGPARAPLVKGRGLAVHDNVSAGGSYGVTGDGTGAGIVALDAFFAPWQMLGNIIEGNLERTITYPPTNTTLAPGTLAAKVDKQYRYLGSEVGSDGQTPGADIDAILKAIPWVVVLP